MSALCCAAEELNVAAASDLNFAFQEISKKYQHDTGNTLKLSFGSSGILPAGTRFPSWRRLG
jgi:ABC-type molybdate transport system substrate-binding protein